MGKYLILTPVAKQEDIPGKANTCVKTQDRTEVQGGESLL